MKGGFLSFDKLGPPSSERRKTGIWRVYSISGDFLGVVQWHAPWRRYTFCTKAAEMVFDYACLTGIANFISDRMNEHSGAGKGE